MAKSRFFLLACLLWGAASCGGDSGTSPSSANGFNGQWNGSSSQGRPIAFTVSSDHVTAITVGYSFGGCSGSRTFSNLNLEIVQDPRGGPPFFNYASSAADGLTQINGFLRTNSTADGAVAFDGYPGCGGGGGFWNATKR